jgi:hypothetical protein
MNLGNLGGRLTPPSAPNISAPGRPIWPAYRAPVKPARGLFAVPAAIFVGTPGAARAAEPVAEGAAAAGFCAALLGALLTICTVLPALILYVLNGSWSFITRPE